MSKTFLKTSQLFIVLNFLTQLFWILHFNFPKTIRLTFEQLEILIITVGIIYLVSGVFVGIYLFKNRYKVSFYILILKSLYYLFTLFYWYQLILFKINLDSYKTAYYGLLVVSLSFGLSLIVSKAKKKYWMKIIGIIITCICLMRIIIELIPQTEDKPTVEILQRIIDFAGSVISICWFLNFQQEIKTLPNENDSLIDIP